jgi:hypothetical protein
MTVVEFRRMLAAEGVSHFGSMLSRLVIPWLAQGLGAALALVADACS